MTEREKSIESFEEFWDFYVGEHKKPATRALHFVGTTAAVACVAGGLLTKRRWLLLVAPFAGYGPAWASHFFIEKNKPASFTYPLWSLQADFVMWWKIASRQMQAEVDRVIRQEEEAEQKAKASGSVPIGAPAEPAAAAAAPAN
jgi:hypothetical protein